jgi:hypothetical protein
VPASGFFPADLAGTIGRGAHGGYNRAFADGWMRWADASVSYEVRDTTSGLRQRETVSFYGGGESTANIHINGGVTISSYRPRGAAPGEWRPVVNDDRIYLASASYQSPTGRFGYGGYYASGFAGLQEYGSLAPNVWLVPGAGISLGYSFERADRNQVQHRHVVSGTWAISRTQSVAARWMEYDGGYYRVSYQRTLGRGIDAYGVYTSDPYDVGRLNVKLVWTMRPFEQR